MASLSDAIYLTWQILYPICLGIINFIVVIGIWMWMSHPRYLYLIYRRYTIWKAGLKLQTITIDSAKYQIAVKGLIDNSRPSLLWIHDFSVDLSLWSSLMEAMDTEIEHMIMIDLPGHGNSWISSQEEFDFESLAKKTKKIIDECGFKNQPLHVIGQGMGGSLAGIMAALYPDQVELVTMICPIINGGVMNEFRRRYKNGDSTWLLPTTKDQLKIMYRHCCYRPVSIPSPVMDGILEDRLQRYHFHDAFLQLIMEERNSNALLQSAKDIRQTSQIIWGNQDEIIPVEEADNLRAVLPNLERCDIIDECGHNIVIEQPEMLLKFLNLYRKNYELKKFK